MTESVKHTVVSFTVTSFGAELYTQDGQVVPVSKEKYNVEKLIEEITPRLRSGGTAIVNLGGYTEPTGSYDVDHVSATKGIFKFVKRAFYTVRSIFKNDQGEEEIKLETIHEPTTVLVVEQEDPKAAPVEIPNAQHLENHIKHAVRKKNLKGIQAFVNRIGKVINERGHSQDDLMKFIERCDMPIADDGCIVAYKTLNIGHGANAGMYVDCHTNSVPQDVGSHVYMDVGMVDPDRRNECSQGLHIAQRGYLRGFRGNEVFIVKIAPEDVVAVPAYDGSKMRVAGYQIVGKLSSAGRDAIFNGNSIEGIEFDEQTVADVIAGKHPAVVHTVHIGGPRGTNLTINGKGAGIVDKLAEPEADEAPQPSKAIPEPAPAVKASEAKAKEAKKPEPVKMELATAKEVIEKSKPISKKERVNSLVELTFNPITDNKKRVEFAQELLEIRKTSKVSWPKLGQNDLTDTKLQDVINNPKKYAKATDVLVKSKADKVESRKAIDLKNLKEAAVKTVSADHTAIVAAFDAGTSFRTMEKVFKKSRKTLRSILGQYRKL